MLRKFFLALFAIAFVFAVVCLAALIKEFGDRNRKESSPRSQQLFWSDTQYKPFIAEVIKFSEVIPETNLKVVLVARARDEQGNPTGLLGAIVSADSPIRIGDKVEAFYANVFNHHGSWSYPIRFVRSYTGVAYPQLPSSPQR